MISSEEYLLKVLSSIIKSLIASFISNITFKVYINYMYLTHRVKKHVQDNSR